MVFIKNSHPYSFKYFQSYKYAETT
jgi:hypothetical protein